MKLSVITQFLVLMMERPRNGKTNVIKFSEKVKEEYNILLGIERIYKTPLHTLKICSFRSKNWIRERELERIRDIGLEGKLD